MNEKLCGYDVEDIALFAEACRKAGITENDLATFAKNAKDAYTFGLKKFEEAVMRNLESDLLYGRKKGE